MKRFALAAFELSCFFGSALGCRAQTYDNTGLAASPDPEAGITDSMIRETTTHRRVRSILARMPQGYAILAEAYSPRRPLPQQLVHQLGGDEIIARLVPHSWSLREAFDQQTEAPDFEAFLLVVARGGKHQALRDTAIEEATLVLDQALDLYVQLKRQGREAA